ncbi:MAG: hypothetical protein QW587_03195 [Candidatus Bathyarchaeia archaeon]
MLLIDVLKDIRDRYSLFDEAYRILNPNRTLAVYPMHIAEEEVIRLATDGGFGLKRQKSRGTHPHLSEDFAQHGKVSLFL